MLYACRSCGRDISSAAPWCPYCGAPPSPPLYAKSPGVRLFHRTALLVILFLPILSLPVVLRWYYKSWDPCVWAERAGAVVEDGDDTGRCLRKWFDAASGETG